MNIKLNYISMQNATTLLDLVDHLWTMGSNFGGTVLSRSHLITVKEKTLSSSDPHQNLLVKSNLPWEMGDPREG
jgi:hypothetical protein